MIMKILYASNPDIKSMFKQGKESEIQGEKNQIKNIILEKFDSMSNITKDDHERYKSP